LPDREIQVVNISVQAAIFLNGFHHLYTLKCCHNILVRCLAHRVRIQTDGTLEKERVLWYRDDLASNLLSRECGDVNSIHANRTPLHIHEAK
jgi:hypothetical protein